MLMHAKTRGIARNFLSATGKSRFSRGPGSFFDGSRCFENPTNLLPHSFHFKLFDLLQQPEKFLDQGTLTWQGANVWVQWFLHAVSRDFDLGKSWSYIWLNAGSTTKVRVLRDGSSSCWDIYLNFHRLKIKIHRVVSEIWPWEFSLLHLKREVCFRIPEYAGVVWSGVVLCRQRLKIHGHRNKFSGCPYASAPIAYDGTV